MDYKDTLNLPKTTFPMRGNLPQKEPVQVEKWEREDIHERMVEANRSVPNTSCTTVRRTPTSASTSGTRSTRSSRTSSSSTRA